MKKNMKQELELMIDAMYQGKLDEEDVQHRDTIQRMVEKHGEELLNPSYFNNTVNHDSSAFGRAMVRTLLSTIQHTEDKKFSFEQVSHLEDIYVHYDFYQAQIRRLIEKYEGHSCCADKTRYLMKLYLGYIQTGAMPEFEDRSHYWVPNSASPEAWMNVLKQCSLLKLGYVEEFLPAREQLIHELEESSIKRLSDNETFCRTHENYVKHETEMIHNKPADVYQFSAKDAEEEHVLKVCLFQYESMRYRHYKIVKGNEDELVDVSIEEQPIWVKKILKTIK